MINKKIGFIFIAVVMMFLAVSGIVFANDLDGIGDIALEEDAVEDSGVSSNSETSSTSGTLGSGSNKEAIGKLFKGIGIDEEAADKASVITEPVAKVMNKIMAIILGFLSMLLFFITLMDMVYIAFPPLRGVLVGQGATQQTGVSSMGMGGYGGGMGMGGYGGGMGGYGGYGRYGGGMGGMGGVQQQGSAINFLGRFVSDEAVAAAQEAQIGATSQATMGAPMGMGMGMGMSTGGNARQPATKSMIFSYMKKRALFLVGFGVCVILFTSTVFTDLGVKLGMVLLDWISGIKIG